MSTRISIPDLTVCLALTALLPACTAGLGSRRSFARESGTITQSEIARIAPVTAYDAVALLRPGFLRAGVISFAPTVYVDGVRMGDINQLALISAMTVNAIQFLDAVQASMLFGNSGRSGPAVVVTTKRGT